jgi:hypothetical protein
MAFPKDKRPTGEQAAALCSKCSLASAEQPDHVRDNLVCSIAGKLGFKGYSPHGLRDLAEHRHDLRNSAAGPGQRRARASRLREIRRQTNSGMDRGANELRRIL